MSAPELSQEIVRQLLHYDPVTGIFTWLSRPTGRPQWNSRYAGKRAGYEWMPNPADRLTYRVIRIFDWPFFEHRLAVLYMNGKWPAHDVDHWDREGTNNRWVNLREATKMQNQGNRSASKNNTSGIKGVYSTPGGRWYSSICGKYLGVFSTKEEAAAIYRAESIKKYGEFARN